jgi:selenocysteine lyase/cysteine desulfurase
VQHPLSLVRSAQSLGYHVLLDAAAFVPAHHAEPARASRRFRRRVVLQDVRLSDRRRRARRAARGARSAGRPWFAGGTIEYASVQLLRHQLRALHDGFEDGTANFLDIAALEQGFAFRDGVGVRA